MKICRTCETGAKPRKRKEKVKEKSLKPVSNYFQSRRDACEDSQAHYDVISDEFLALKSHVQSVTMTEISPRATMTFGKSKAIGKKRNLCDREDADSDGKAPDTVFNSDSDDTPQKKQLKKVSRQVAKERDNIAKERDKIA